MEDNWDKKRKALISRLSRVEGQLRGIQRMMEEQQDCEPVAQQLAAARRALDKAFFETMACAMEQELCNSTGKPAAEVENHIRHITGLLSKYS